MKRLFDMFSPQPKIERKEVVEIENVVVKDSKKYSPDIEEVHKDFFSASEKLLADAKLILDSTINTEKCDRLKALGFTNVPEVIKLNQQQEELKKNHKLLDLISYYQKEYPFHKFITKEQVEEICKKYSLVQGEIGWYTGFVPENNLKQIENFKIKEKDKVQIGVLKDGEEIEFPKEMEIWGENIGITLYCHMFNGSPERNMYGFLDKHAFQSNDRINWYAEDRYDIFGLKYRGSIKFTLESTNKFTICAPEKWMNVPKDYRLEGTKYVKKIKDPVVLSRVRGGYLIVTAWGDEASDPIVVNPINN